MTGPFVSFKMQPTLNVNSTPTLIFGSQVTCLLDSVLLANQGETSLVASLWIAREVEPGQETEFMLARRVPLAPFAHVDVLLQTTLTLEPGDLLYARSDYSDNLFNSFVSYRAFNELAKDLR